MPKLEETITKDLCESKPSSRIRVYDRHCAGLFVSVTKRGVASSIGTGR